MWELVILICLELCSQKNKNGEKRALKGLRSTLSGLKKHRTGAKTCYSMMGPVVLRFFEGKDGKTRSAES